VRPTSKATIAKLQERGVKVAMITGDNQATAARIGKELGIDIVLADVLPGQKAAEDRGTAGPGPQGRHGRRRRQRRPGPGAGRSGLRHRRGHRRGDGKRPGGADEAATPTTCRSAPIELSRATLRKMHQNLWWAVGYNVIAFPLAAGVFYPLHAVTPEVAALSMSGSSAIVAINALMLKRTKLAGIRSPHPCAGRVVDDGARGASA
jgi:Cu2+-exporting ATPase